MARLTRHDLKQDELKSTFERFQHFMEENFREILAVVGMVILVVGLAGGLKLYSARQEAEANAQLGAALKTFRAYVGTAAPSTLGTDEQTFPTAQEKYKKALEKFSQMTQVKGFRKFLPWPKAVTIARYHAGVCQAHLGDHENAIKTLREAGADSDREIASLAQYALAGVLAKTGKLPEAVKLYQELADHATSTVPRATAMLAMADAYRAAQPARARQIYERMEKEFGSDVVLAEVIKQEISSLPR